MKTLKKTLCLVLAMVMVFGLCVTSASAKLDAYEDKDTITYAEAVDVMTGIGILAGDAGGFRPTDDINRAEAAKIISYIMIGDSDRADALKATSDPFPDVPASHWAAGYISYCATAGIIAGKGDGYYPSDNVTGLEFAKMLLKALGYGVNDEYIGTDWAINVSRDALRLRIFEKNIAGANNNKATREECALYAFNAVTKVDKVSYSALLGGYITSIGSGLGSSTGTDAPDANMADSFANDFLLVKEYNEIDAFGRDTGHHWVINNNRRPIITAEYDANEYLKANANDEIWATFTSEVTGGDIYKVLGADVSKDSTTLELYVNGTHSGVGYDGYDNDNPDVSSTAMENNLDKESAGQKADPDVTGKVIVLENFKKSNDKILTGTGNGVQTFVYGKYIKGTLRVKICLVDTYLAQVTRVVEAKGNKDAETSVKLVKKMDGDNTKVYIPDDTYAFTTDEFAKDDYVLVTIADKDNVDNDLSDNYGGNLGKDGKGIVYGEVQTMIPAITKDSEVSKYNKRSDFVSIEADGVTYVAAKNAAGDDSNKVTNLGLENAACINNTIVDNNVHTLYLDEFGYLIATSPLKNATNYVYVAQFGLKADPNYQLTDKFVLRAHVFYADGTDEVVTVDHKAGIFSDEGMGAMTINKLSQIADRYGDTFDRVEPDPDDEDDDVAFEIGLYSLTMEKGKAVLNKEVPDTIKGGTKDNYVKYLSMSEEDATNGTTGMDPTDLDDTPFNADSHYVSKGQATIDREKTNNRAGNKTVFFYVSGDYSDEDNFKVTVYTGIKDIPTTLYKNKADARLSEYAYPTNNAEVKAVEAAVIDAKAETKSSSIIYFFGGTQDEANFTKYKDGTVSYRIYGAADDDTAVTREGDETRLVIDYKTVTAADNALRNLNDAGFVKVINDDLQYVCKPHHDWVKKDGDYYIDIAELRFDAGLRNNTVRTLLKGEDGTPETDGIYMPLYKLEELDAEGKEVIVDLRKDEELDKTAGRRITSVGDLFSLIDAVELNHDEKLDNNIPNVTVDGLKVAIHFTGYNKTDDRTNVIYAIYILDNVECTPVAYDEGHDNDDLSSTEFDKYDHVSDLYIAQLIADAAGDD